MEEKIFIIPLRKEFSKKPIYRRAKKAVTAVKEYALKHLKVNEVRIGNNLNMHLWSQGNRNPPPKVKVKAIVKDGIGYVELPKFEFGLPKEEEKPKTVAEKLLSKKDEEKKEQEKELNKELKHEDDHKHKKEHKHETIDKPSKAVKQESKVKEDIQREGRVIGSTGKKGAKESKP